MFATASAKSVITVGATENVRANGIEDVCGNVDADNAADIAAFSSRGPALDGRMKPDLVAPGVHIQGPASQAPGYQLMCYGGAPYFPEGQTLYLMSSGTSFSAPGVAGAAALAGEYYQRVHSSGVAPSPAMIKAMLLNTPRYLNGVAGGGDLPTISQGWGLVDVGALYDPTRWTRDQEVPFTASGQAYQQQFTVADPAKPTRITLAYSDAPGATVGDAWVNDLDLEVYVGGQLYRGNVFAGDHSVAGGARDFRNNVEQVWLPAGLSGPVSVVVRATNIAGDGVPGGTTLDQDFALTSVNLTAAGSAAALPYIAGVNLSEAAPGADGDGLLEPGEPLNTTVDLGNAGTSPLTAGRLTATVVTGPATALQSPMTVPEVVSAGGTRVPGPSLLLAPSAACGEQVTLRITYATGPAGTTGTTPSSTCVPAPSTQCGSAQSTRLAPGRPRPAGSGSHADRVVFGPCRSLASFWAASPGSRLRPRHRPPGWASVVGSATSRRSPCCRRRVC